MLVYVHPPHEDWIVDRFVNEWSSWNQDISTRLLTVADKIWLLADWAWKNVDKKYLLSKPVLTTVHHITPTKFDQAAYNDFMLRDQITTCYHVYNERAFKDVTSLTNKPVKLVKYWANNEIWRPSSLSRAELRSLYNIPNDKFVIGSFQRDTEGTDLTTPKLEKGPDLFCDYVEKLHKTRDIFVLLSGWRRQYVMRRLDKANISYKYVERPQQQVINDLYQCLDLYAVTARYEGGPQSLIECGLLNVPVVSTPVGIAEQVLPQTAISLNVLDATPAIPDVSDMLPNVAIPRYRNLLQELAR